MSGVKLKNEVLFLFNIELNPNTLKCNWLSNLGECYIEFNYVEKQINDRR